MLEYDCACKLFLPEPGVIGKDLYCVFEEGVVDGVGVAFFEVTFHELDFLFKIFGGLQFEVQISSHSDLVDVFIFLGVLFAVELAGVVLDEAGVYSS